MNPDGSKYIDIYYAGPIRAAGGTAAVLPLILGDYARKILDLDVYKPTEDEIERYVEEMQIYNSILTRQYRISDEEVRKIVMNCPVCINGEPTEEAEVSVHRDLKRIPTNRVRGGMCLVLSEGIALKAKKILKYAEMFGLNWSWLEEIIKVEKTGSSKEIEIKPLTKYLEGTAVGRPIFSYPSRFGGFRLRYGRTRATGIMAKAIHPATMHILDDFIAVGTQLKVERPGKSAGITPCSTIEGPIIKLVNGDVVKIKSSKEAIELKNKLKEILFLGDMLICFGDFKYSNELLLPAGYNEEYWLEELKEKITAENNEEINKIAEKFREISFEEAIEISKKYDVPLHPAYIYYFTALSLAELIEIIKAEKRIEAEKIIIENSIEIKNSLEKIGMPHKLREEKLIIEGSDAKAFKLFFEHEKEKIKLIEKEEDILKALSKLTQLKIKDKAGSFIGARMGRPEQSAPREMKPSPHVLFPVGEMGKQTRSINKALEEELKEEKLEVEIALFKCPKCNKEKEFPYCYECNTRTIKLNFCPKCNNKTLKDYCEKCNTQTKAFTKRVISLEKIIRNAEKNLGMKMPSLVKGVKGLMSEKKIAEPLEKGFLRAMNDLHVYKDGTIRYELINATLTHFKPKEANVSIEKLKELGYTKDINGKPIENNEQLIELMPQDLIIHEKAIEFFLKVTQFIDAELEYFYKLKPIYNFKTKEDVIGTLVLGLAPHTSAAVIGRIIGFTKARVCFAHPYFHQAKRRNIDGDQDSLMLLMDALLNFSRKYLKHALGSEMDVPLVFTIQINPLEIDEEVHSMDISSAYGIDFYRKSEIKAKPEDIQLKIVKNVLETEQQYSNFNFTHDVEDINEGPNYSKYVTLKSMEEKLLSQIELQKKIKAVDIKDSIERILVSHLMPDIIGNTRSFGKQKIRCTKCNTKYRRIPLSGKCRKCKEKGNLVLTIHEGTAKKYLELAKRIAAEFNLSNYLKQRITLIEEEINSIFLSDNEKQKSLGEFV